MFQVDLILVQSPCGRPQPPGLGDLTSALCPLEAVVMCWSRDQAGSGEESWL